MGVGDMTKAARRKTSCRSCMRPESAMRASWSCQEDPGSPRRARSGFRCLALRVSDREVRHLISTGYLAERSKQHWVNGAAVVPVGSGQRPRGGPPLGCVRATPQMRPELISWTKLPVRSNSGHSANAASVALSARHLSMAPRSQLVLAIHPDRQRGRGETGDVTPLPPQGCASYHCAGR
jgi:hypothetical protein